MLPRPVPRRDNPHSHVSMRYARPAQLASSGIGCGHIRQKLSVSVVSPVDLNAAIDDDSQQREQEQGNQTAHNHSDDA